LLAHFGARYAIHRFEGFAVQLLSPSGFARAFPALATPFTLLLAQRPQGQLPGRPVLLRFLVIRVLAAAVAELRELETAGGRLLVLRRRVIPLLANGALQCDDFAHLFILTDRPG
jgi:hypothetical protein